jgi:hypothetical protein
VALLFEHHTPACLLLSAAVWCLEAVAAAAAVREAALRATAVLLNVQVEARSVVAPLGRSAPCFRLERPFSAGRTSSCLCLQRPLDADGDYRLENPGQEARASGHTQVADRSNHLLIAGGHHTVHKSGVEGGVLEEPHAQVRIGISAH